MYWFNYIIIILVLINLGYGYQCKDGNNEEVDWYVLYKIPLLVRDNNTLIKEGLAYAYITSKSINDWKLSEIPINSTKSIPALTLQPLYNNAPFHLLYNDQPPEKGESDRGHTKGCVLSNSTHGLWLVHSVPRFPSPSNYSYPRSGIPYGQSFLCISLNITNVNLVGQQLFYNEPHIYSKYIDETVAKVAPFMANIANNNTVSRPPWYNILNISSTQNQIFTSFAKSRNFGLDLYKDLVATTLKSNLYVETWQNGRGSMKSNCTGDFEVDNIRGIYFDTLGISFKNSYDHSKWAITRKVQFVELVWVCIGDINRQEHQMVRGGGTVCINNEKLWNIYLGLAASIEMCKKQHSKELLKHLFTVIFVK